jgi:hypothetical protein
MTMIVCAGGLIGPSGPGRGVWEHVRSALASGNAETAIAVALLAIGLLTVLGSWIVLGVSVGKGLQTRQLLWVATWWTLPLLIAPPIYSRDLYSYAAIGHMVVRHLDPYRVGPAALGASPFAKGVSPAWRHTQSPYGPLFIGLCALVAHVAGSSVMTAILLLRGVEVVGVGLIALGLRTLATRTGHDPARAIWLGVCNPLVLLHFIGGAHNDALMIGLTVCGLALARCNYPIMGLLCCVAAAAIKAPAAIAAVFIIAEAARAVRPGRRMATGAGLSAVAAGSFVALTWVTQLGFGWVRALGTPGTNRLLLTPTTLATQLISDVTGHDAAVRFASQATGFTIIAVGIGYLLHIAPRLGTARACGIAFALIAICGPVLLPWYALWALVVLAASARRAEQQLMILASVVLAVVLKPSGASMPDFVLIAAVIALGTATVTVATTTIRRRLRHDPIAAT